MPSANPILFADPAHQPLLRLAGIDADSVFTHPDIRVWRSIPERENATLDVALPDGSTRRLHVKRHKTARPAADEAHGLSLLRRHDIPTVDLVAWGHDAAGRGFLITLDLAGYQPLDKWIDSAGAFSRVSEAVADLAAKLHAAGLHHRDLYLCHFFVRDTPAGPDLRLIDAGRVRPLPRWPFRQRWIVKDLAQLWYSTLALPIAGPQRLTWLTRYAQQRQLPDVMRLHRAIERKIRWIARHDAHLRCAQPTRNISLRH